MNQTQNQIALQVRQLCYGILIAQLKQQAAQQEGAASQVKLRESLDEVERGQALDVVALESRASSLDARQAALVQRLQIRDLTLDLNDLLGLPLNTNLQLDADTSASSPPSPSREECIRIAQQHSPEIQAARQSVEKAKAGLAAAKDQYIPDVTGLARYSCQSGIPFLVHNFGTFGISFTYDLFDGGKRIAEVKDSRTLLSQAELNLLRIEEQVTVQVETAYDKVEQMQDLAGFADEVDDQCHPDHHRHSRRGPPWHLRCDESTDDRGVRHSQAQMGFRRPSVWPSCWNQAAVALQHGVRLFRQANPHARILGGKNVDAECSGERRSRCRDLQSGTLGRLDG